MQPVTEAAAQSSPPARRGSGTVRFLRDILIIILIALVVSFVVKTFLVRSFYIPSGSMEHTLEINDRILVNELVPGVGALKRGDVVVFTDPGGWLTGEETSAGTTPTGLAWLLDVTGLVPADSDNHLIKRVIGLPGDTVTCCSVAGHLTVNGTPITEPYINVKAGKKAAQYRFSVTVPKNRLWVEGDNRYNSADSAYNRHIGTPGGGFVPVSDVVGRAFVITWPSAHWGWLSNFPSVFADVPTPKAAAAGTAATTSGR